jgi:hypothetical protein
MQSGTPNGEAESTRATRSAGRERPKSGGGGAPSGNEAPQTREEMLNRHLRLEGMEKTNIYGGREVEEFDILKVDYMSFIGILVDGPM